VWGRHCACEILIANPIDWLFAAGLEVETGHHLILIRLYFILTILITEDDHNHSVFDWIKAIAVGRHCACEILIANPIDWLFAAGLEYFIFFSIDSSEARKRYDE
jgi:hypothetical protein